MAQNLQIRRSDGNTFGTNDKNDSRVIHPETNPNQVIGLLDDNGKINLSWISNALLGGHKNIGGISKTPMQLYELFGKVLKNAAGMGLYVNSDVIDPSTAHHDLKNVLTGRFFQVQEIDKVTISNDNFTNVVANANPDIKVNYTDFYGSESLPYTFKFEFDGDDDVLDKEVESGDLVVFNDIVFASPVINTNNIPKYIYDGIQNEEPYVNEIVADSILFQFNNLRYANPTTRKLTYGSVIITAQNAGVSNLPNGGASTVVIGDKVLQGIGNLTHSEEGSTNPWWALTHTFYDVSFTLTQSEWDAVYSLEGDNSEITVHFGVVNNTYRDASVSQKGIVRLASVAQGEAGSVATVAMTPASTKAAIEALGLKVSGIPSANEGTRGMVTLASEAETINGTDDSKVITPKKAKLAVETFGLKLASYEEAIAGTDSGKAMTPARTKEAINHFGSIEHFDTLEEANNSDVVNIAGKVVFVG